MVHGRRRIAMALALAGVLSLVAAACGGGKKTVGVTVQEFAVVPAESSSGSGETTFNVTNKGPDDVHEFVVIKTDLAPDALPTDENGAVEETGAGIEVIGEIEDIPVGETPSVTLDLAAGKYVLICNIWDETEQEAHYSLGMRTSFEVTG
jgi:uncharacterized cupredoxin-like copper-binding protein